MLIRYYIRLRFYLKELRVKFESILPNFQVNPNNIFGVRYRDLYTALFEINETERNNLVLWFQISQIRNILPTAKKIVKQIIRQRCNFQYFLSKYFLVIVYEHFIHVSKFEMKQKIWVKNIHAWKYWYFQTSKTHLTAWELHRMNTKKYSVF